MSIPGEEFMEASKRKGKRKKVFFAAIIMVVNILVVLAVGRVERNTINKSLTDHAMSAKVGFENVMNDYERSFKLFVQMMSREIENNPDPDIIWDYLKNIDKKLLAIEGETYDGLYMYYKGRYLYSWDTPYSVYEESGYVATERPWYKDAAAGKGGIVFTPPYMSYANHYILTTISQLQPDGETVFAYDIKMADIQSLVTSMEQYQNAQMMVCDDSGTVIGSTKEEYLGGDLYSTLDEAASAVETAKNELAGIADQNSEEAVKLRETADSAAAFYEFRSRFEGGLQAVFQGSGKSVPFKMDGKKYYGCLLKGNGFDFLVFVPAASILTATMDIWLIPILVTELLLIYVLSRVSVDQKNRELKEAYVELGQTQRRLEIALSAAQKAAAVDDLTGMMNLKSFRKEMNEILQTTEQSGILIMIDGDHFKRINDTYGHSVGDEVIKLTAQMIIGRIRTIDLASRLHGDEFAIFVTHTSDYSVAEKIMKDINETLAAEAKRRNMPSITLSAGAAIVNPGDKYSVVAKAADAALYVAKESHNGGFSC